jgi:hypothetical protein
MSKEVKKQDEKQPELKAGAHAHSSSNYPRQEVESRRVGLQSKLAEVPADAVENKSAHQDAKNRRFATNGEPSAAPCYAEDVE